VIRDAAVSDDAGLKIQLPFFPNAPVQMRIDVRLATAVVIIAICSFSVAWGWRIVHFSLAMANVASSEKREDIINSWSSVSGVASKALQAELADKIDVSNAEAVGSRRAALASILAIEPLNSADWLSLSGLQFETDQPMEQVFDSLELSVLTGPNEGHIMAGRAIFALSLWERLPPDLKSHVAADLRPIIFPNTPAEGAEGDKFRALLATKPARVRKDLRDALIASGVSPKMIEDRLGF
jgi:hypothetical protein